MVLNGLKNLYFKGNIQIGNLIETKLDKVKYFQYDDKKYYLVTYKEIDMSKLYVYIIKDDYRKILYIKLFYFYIIKEETAIPLLNLNDDNKLLFWKQLLHTTLLKTELDLHIKKTNVFYNILDILSISGYINLKYQSLNSIITTLFLGRCISIQSL